VTVLNSMREVQILLIAALLLGGCLAKLMRTLRTGSAEEGFGPTALFPLRMRRPVTMVMYAIEAGIGIGLIVTAGSFGQGAAATSVRLGAGLLFLVATSALIELRTTRPDVGCGCFGDFSTAPVSGRTLARSALLAAAAFSTLGLPAVSRPSTGGQAASLLAIMIVELVVLAALSPEVGEGLVRLGYSEPCELRAMSAERTLAALRRSKHWRRHAGLITAETPTDVWRELCWRYVVFPARHQDRATEVVFAVFLQQRRPAIHVALVDAVTGEPMPWPAPPSRTGGPSRRASRLRPGTASGRPGAVMPSARIYMPFSSDL
jgi:hypothetical protein